MITEANQIHLKSQEPNQKTEKAMLVDIKIGVLHSVTIYKPKCNKIHKNNLTLLHSAQNNKIIYIAINFFLCLIETAHYQIEVQKQIINGHENHHHIRQN